MSHLLILVLLCSDNINQPFDIAWQSIGMEQGLVSDKVFSIVAESHRLWVGTENGLSLLADNSWTHLGSKDGLVYPVITHMAHNPETGDLWIATMGGVSRYNAGEFNNFTQRNSGLANDVVYAVAVTGHHIWFATAAGANRYDTWTDTWDIFTNRNAPMHEIWCYGLSIGKKKVNLAVWGGGLLQYDMKSERWRSFRDPDGEMEMDLLRDDGPVSDVIASVSYANGLVWLGTYFGANRYDGRRWQGFSIDDSGLASDFINFVLAEGNGAWFGTDMGLSHFDGTRWTTYLRDDERESGIIRLWDRGETQNMRTQHAICDNFILAIARQNNLIWIGTERGLSYGAVPNALIN